MANSTFFWTKDSETRLAALWRHYYLPDQIASILKTTPAEVLFKARKLRLPMRERSDYYNFKSQANLEIWPAAPSTTSATKAPAPAPAFTSAPVPAKANPKVLPDQTQPKVQPKGPIRPDYDSKLHMSTDEVIHYCNIAKTTLSLWIKKKYIEPVKLQGTRHSQANYYLRSEVQALYKKRMQTDAANAAKPKPTNLAALLTSDTKVWSDAENRAEIEQWLKTHEITRCSPGRETENQKPRGKDMLNLRRKIMHDSSKWRRFRAQVFYSRLGLELPPAIAENSETDDADDADDAIDIDNIGDDINEPEQPTTD